MNNQTTVVAPTATNATTGGGWVDLEAIKVIEKIIASMPVLLIVFGCIFNTCAFLVFRFNESMKKMSSMMLLSFVVVTDTISLFEWNLAHFTAPFFNFYFHRISVGACRIYSFSQYWSLQCSGTLLSIICIDRYFSIIATPGSWISRLPFGTPKSAFIWSVSTLVTIGIFNSHILMFNGWVNPPKETNVTMSMEINGTMVNSTSVKLVWSGGVNCNSLTTGFKIWPQWDLVNTYVYNLVPFVVMTTFNVLLMRVLIGGGHKKGADRAAFIKKRRISITLITISVAFLVMTLPATLAYGYFITPLMATPTGAMVAHLLDCISFANHASVFWSCFITNVKFREVVMIELGFYEANEARTRATSVQTQSQKKSKPG